MHALTSRTVIFVYKEPCSEIDTVPFHMISLGGGFLFKTKVTVKLQMA